ncbi:MAG: class I SAM-dependent methyltransferase [Chloroflexi bacterium]|nr:class I SAM-dependent methyltransferase [Chloroflexota bacterium]
MSDLPLSLPGDLAGRLASALDLEGKILRGLEALGPVAGRDVVLVDADGSAVAAGLGELGARVRHHDVASPFRTDLPDASVDVVVGLWSAFRGVDPAEMAEVDRILRPDGKLLVVHDYGRDDVSRIVADRPEYGSWGRRTGPFLTSGFRVRVLHCFWTFESPEATAAFLSDAFGEVGAAVAATLKRPRLSWNVAIYHRSRSATA